MLRFGAKIALEAEPIVSISSRRMNKVFYLCCRAVMKKSLRGVRAWLLLRMWSEKTGRRMTRRIPMRSKTPATVKQAAKVLDLSTFPAHGRCEAPRVAPGGVPFLSRKRAMLRTAFDSPRNVRSSRKAGKNRLAEFSACAGSFVFVSKAVLTSPVAR